MISYNKDNHSFHLHTKSTSYVFFVNERKHLQQVYYGAKIKDIVNLKDFLLQFEFELGTSVSYSEDDKGYMLNYTLLEQSTYGKGDFRNPLLHIELPTGSRTTDFRYESHQELKDLHFDGMPQVRKQNTLEVKLIDKEANLELYLYYTVLEDEDVIVRNSKLVNKNEEKIVIDKALSMQLDLLNKEYQLLKLDGAWIRERNISIHNLTKGIFTMDSKQGNSSNGHNPFFLLKEQTTNEVYGNVYGMALVYSGNFEANIEINSHDFLRMNIGVNGFDFRYPLEKGEEFITPEVLLSFSETGMSKISNQFHDAINNHIISPNFKEKERPILVNNWEATYFDFNQKKLLAIAKKAKKLGIELFCLDDGWFSRRNDDFSSLGDWYYNKKKLPSGVKGICDKVNKLGLDFGIWVEPEMVNRDSELYR